jgi:pantothenate kinase
MLVKDIYGDQSPIAGLQGDYLASSFAKPANDHSTKVEDLQQKYKKEDILHSLIFMISFNIG